MSRETTPTPPATVTVGVVARMAAPWIAVPIGFVWLESAWLAIGMYHAQILGWWAWDRWRAHRAAAPVAQGDVPEPAAPVGDALPALRRTRTVGLVGIVAPVAAGPAVYALVPAFQRTELGDWLAAYGLTGTAWLLMMAYFALVHPAIEQLHWGPLRARFPSAHVAFGGYHAIVLAGLLGWPAALAIAAGLVAVSIGWRWLTISAASRAPAVVSHTIADAGVVVAAALLLAR